MLDLVQHLFGGDEAAGSLDGAVDDATANGIQAGRAGVARYFNVTEPVVGKSRFIVFKPASAQDVNVAGLGAPDILAIDHAIRIDQFAEAKRDRCPARPPDK